MTAQTKANKEQNQRLVKRLAEPSSGSFAPLPSGLSITRAV